MKAKRPVRRLLQGSKLNEMVAEVGVAAGS